MNSKEFEYKSKDKPFLNKDIRMRTLFLCLFSCVFVWQIISIIIEAINSSLSNWQLISGIFIAVLSLVFVLICLLYINKSLNALRNIKNEGRSISSVLLLAKTDKNSFIRLYQILSNVLALIMLFVLISGITYLILQIVYLSTYSFYLPLLFLLAISGFNSVYHLKYEITILKEVEKYNSYF